MCVYVTLHYGGIRFVSENVFNRMIDFCFFHRKQKKNKILCVHLFLLVIGVVIFIWAEFDATAMFRCDVIKPRAVNCFALIVDVAIVGTLLGLCCCICGCVCCG